MSAGQPGARAVVSHLAQALLIQATRLYLTESGATTPDALQGLLHRGLGPAGLTSIHNQPEAPWTVASLAERANMSRSAFSASFTKVLGMPPMQYLPSKGCVPRAACCRIQR